MIAVFFVDEFELVSAARLHNFFIEVIVLPILFNPTRRVTAGRASIMISSVMAFLFSVDNK